MAKEKLLDALKNLKEINDLDTEIETGNAKQSVIEADVLSTIVIIRHTDYISTEIK